MLKPKKEDKEAFIQRCMSNPRMETEYPTRIQRRRTIRTRTHQNTSA